MFEERGEFPPRPASSSDDREAGKERFRIDSDEQDQDENNLERGGEQREEEIDRQGGLN